MDDPRTNLITSWIKDFRKGLLIFAVGVVMVGVFAYVVASMSAN